MTTDMREKIEAMLAGLEGVTPGPWDFDTELQADTSPRYNEFALFSKDGLRLCSTENCDYRFAEIATEYDDDGSYSWNEPARILMEHLARCDPDTIRELCRLAKIGMETDEKIATAAEIERLRTRVEKTEALLIKARTEALKEAILALTIRASERNVEWNDNIEPELNKARRDELLEAAKVILKMKDIK